MSNVLDFPKKQEPLDFHVHILAPGDTEEVIKLHGYLKFSPQHLVMLDSPGEDGNVIFAADLRLVRYVKKIEDDSVQATLSF